MSITTKQFQLLSDINMVWDFLTDIYDRETGSGAAAPFFVLKEMSMTHPIVAMEDESAIFIKANAVWKLGKVHWIGKGGITTITDETLEAIGNTL